MGYDAQEYTGRPVIGILNTWSELNPCHTHFRERAEEVKRGVWQAGGFPVELPAMSLSEPFQKPTTMLYRNMLAMEAEELLRSHPVDGAVLMGGCDKTTPGLVMGATSMGLPFLFLPAGPMLPGRWGTEVLGSGSDTWKYWDRKRAGTISEEDWRAIEGGIARSPVTSNPRPLVPASGPIVPFTCGRVAAASAAMRPPSACSCTCARIAACTAFSTSAGATPIAAKRARSCDTGIPLT